MSSKKMADQQASHENTHVENTSGNAQRARLLERLKAGPIDTFTAIRELNIVRPGARINELRALGHKIHTHLRTTSCSASSSLVATPSLRMASATAARAVA